MNQNSSHRSVPQILSDLEHMLESPGTDAEENWVAKLLPLLAEIELALGEEATDRANAESLQAIATRHPRLIHLCSKFQEHGRRLLRQAALVVKISARNHRAGTPPVEELRKAASHLAEAIRRHLDLESQLMEEADYEDLGGQG